MLLNTSSTTADCGEGSPSRYVLNLNIRTNFEMTDQSIDTKGACQFIQCISSFFSDIQLGAFQQTLNSPV